MKLARIAVVLAAVVTFSTAAAAQAPPAFEPRTKTVLGTDAARTPIAFAQVISQRPGELSIGHLVEEFVNLVPNWPVLAKKLLSDPRPVIAHTTVVWADQVLKVTCWVDRANSNLALGHLRVVMEVTEGTTVPVPLGTIFAVTDSRLGPHGLKLALTTQVPIEPGIMPEVMPSGMTMVTQIVPELWKTGRRGKASLTYTFTSVAPPDGSPPLVHVSREDVPIR
jgi:hypothetical protein